MRNIADTSGHRVAVIALSGVLALLLQTSAASAQTCLFNRVGFATGTNPAAGVTGSLKNGRPTGAVLAIDANFASGSTNSGAR